uniref:Ras-related GTPase n=1 Tax=Pithovirus LCPAC103 TaxID=2506588 RepID=A0A481Z383_9VIRU|nr:MAG: Ras-related GTPase [Pithovirus LCPAC103]
MEREFKIVLIGDKAVGKSAYLRRLLTKEYDESYAATLGVATHPLDLPTNYGIIKFNMWDTAGDDRFRGIGSAYYSGADGAIIMFALDSSSSFAKVKKFYRDLLAYGAIPVVICGNKLDLSDRTIQLTDSIERERTTRDGVPVINYGISVKHDQNLHQPLLWLARKLTGFHDLQFVD